AGKRERLSKSSNAWSIWRIRAMSLGGGESHAKSGLKNLYLRTVLERNVSLIELQLSSAHFCWAINSSQDCTTELVLEFERCRVELRIRPRTCSSARIAMC